MLGIQEIPVRKEDFLFADHLVLDDSPTRDFYKDLLRGLAHKNNNVLAVVQGFSSLILMEEGLDADTTESVRHMRQAAQSSSDLSERVLTAGGVARISKQALRLEDFFPLMEERMRSICDKRGVMMSLTVARGLPPVEADTSRLKELILELVRNAAEAAATAGVGQVQIEVLGARDWFPEEGRSRVHLIVRNNGAHIPEEKLAEVFRPFHTTKGSGHFGIGLTSAGVVAGQMGMRLGIASEPGQTTVWLSMPLAEKA